MRDRERQSLAEKKKMKKIRKIWMGEKTGRWKRAAALLCAAAVVLPEISTNVTAVNAAQESVSDESAYDTDSAAYSGDGTYSAGSEDSASNENASYEDASGAEVSNGDASGSTDGEGAAQTTADETDTSSEDALSGEENAGDSTATTAETAEEPTYASGTLTYDGNGYTVTATFDASAALPENVTLTAKEVLQKDPDNPQADIYTQTEDGYNYDDYLSLTQRRIQEENTQDGTNDALTFTHFYDITFTDADGNEVEPAADSEVKIAVSYDQPLEVSENETVNAFHFDEDELAKSQSDTLDDINIKDAVKIQTTEAVTADNATASDFDASDSDTADVKTPIGEVRFDANAFSVYAIVGTQDETNMQEAAQDAAQNATQDSAETAQETGNAQNESAAIDGTGSEGTSTQDAVTSEDGTTSQAAASSEASTQAAVSSEGANSSENEAVSDDTASSQNTAFSEDKSASQEETESQSEQEDTGSQADQAGSVTLPAAENDDYKVTITYDSDEVTNIPEDATVSVNSYAEDSDEYAAAKEAVIAAKTAEDENFDEDSLGLKALDISILDKDGNEIEPDGTVSVRIEVKDAPENYDVQHIKETKASPIQNLMGLLKKALKMNSASTTATAETVAEGVEGDTAEFTVDSFSVFTITWTVNTGSASRIGQVTVHYIDANGLEHDLADDQTIDVGDLAKENGGIVDLKTTWGSKTITPVQGENAGNTYTYDHAAIETRNGTTITGLRVVTASTSGDTTTYKLYYTSDSIVNTIDATKNSWIEYKDSVSGNNTNNADVYLVYTFAMTAPLTIHYLTLDGVALKDEDGNEITKTIDAATLSGTTDVVDLASGNNAINGYSVKNANGYNNNNPLLNSRFTTKIETGVINTGNTYFRRLKYDKEDGGDNYYIYAGRGTGNGATWTTPGQQISSNANFSTPDIYITLQPDTNLKVTVHRVDENGNAISGAADVTKTVSNKGVITPTDSDLAISGYTATSGYYDWVNKDSKGTKFATMTYSQGESRTSSSTTANTQWKSSYTTSGSTSSTTTDNLETELWIVYTAADSMPVTIHHLNNLGAEIATTTQSVMNGSTLTADSITKASGRTANYTYSTYYMDGETKTNFSSIAYSYADSTWSSKVDSSDTATSSPINEVYLVYTPSTLATLYFHYVDEAGGRLAADYSEALTHSYSTWDGWGLPRHGASGVGTYQFGYVGKFGENKAASGYTAMYKLVDGTYHTGIGATTDATTKAATKEIYAEDGTSPILLTDIYQVYGGNGAKKGVTYHHVNASGTKIAEDTYATVSSGGSITPESESLTTISGMAFSKACIGNYNGTEVSRITYSYDNSQETTTKRWSSTYTSSTQTTATATPGDTAVNEVWLVYTEGPQKTAFNVHYVYIDNNGKTTHIVTQNNQTSEALNTITDDARFTLTNDKTVKNLTTTSAQETGGIVKTGLTYNGKSVQYMSTRISSADGFDATSVYVDTDGTIVYQNGTTNNVSRYNLTAEENTTNRWSGSSSGGREFTLIRDTDGNMTLVDSQHGSVSLNISSSDGNTYYTATFHGEEETTTYSVYWNSVANGYALDVTNYIPNDSKDIYVIYIDESGDDGKIWIDDDLRYTGMLKEGESGITTTQTKSYEWHRVVTGTGAEASTTRSTADLAADPVASRSSVQYAAGSDGTIVTMRAWLDSVAGEDGNTVIRTDQKSSATLTLSDGSTITVTRTDNTSDDTVSYAVSTSGTTETVTMPTAGNSTSVTINGTTVTIAIDSDNKATITTATGGKTTSTTELTKGKATTTVDTQDVALTNTERKQTGNHWNVAAHAQDRTWLDVEADEGSDTWTYGTNYKYYVTLTYTPQAEPKALVSNIQNIDYYGQLENGSFERPSINSSDEGYVTPTSGSSYYSNADYKAAGGVWQTTGTGKASGNPDNGNHLNQDIEVINVKKNPGADYSSYYFESEDTFKADAGDQFVELNAEASGALYQDVITHPNETLSYGLSHRARGNSDVDRKTSEYDTMYLIIMPTKLAMTSGSGGTELTTQSDLLTFIENHGGISYDKPTEADYGTRLTYYDEENGILIRKITSSDQAWQHVSVTNGYTAKGGLTRFFFVAGPTSYSGWPKKENGGRSFVETATHGNFIDKVSFSQNLPEPEGFNLTVSKTFTGLTQEQIADLAASKDGTANSNPFTFTITDTYTQSNAEHVNDTLENAKLQFTAVKSGTNSYTYTLSAKQWQKKNTETNVWSPITEETYNKERTEENKDNYRIVDLMQETDSSGNVKNSGTARVSTDGSSVTMTWTFTEQSLPSHAADLVFNYTVAESNYSVSGLIPTHTYSLNGGTTQSGTSGMIGIRQGNTARYAFANSYAENTGNPSQITVTKTFSGVTRTTVEKLLAGYSEEVSGQTYTQDPYSITITKTVGDDGNTISDGPSLTLTPTNIGRVAVKGSGDDTQYANVSYNLYEDTSTGKVTLTWIIQEEKPSGTTSDAVDVWMGGPGTYSLSEKNYTPTPHATTGSETDQNELKSVEVNGKDLNPITPTNGSIALGTVQTGKVGETDYSPTMTGTGNVTDNPSGTLTVSSDINLIIGRTSDSNYVVWTQETAGANLRQSVISFINRTTGLGSGDGAVTATLANTSFRSGVNPGTLKYNTAHGGTTVSYSGGETVTFTNETVEEGTAITWTKGYATTYSLTNYSYVQSDTFHYGMTNNTTEVRVANGYEPIVRLRKADSADEDTVLGNAVFRIFKYEGNTKKYLMTDNENQNESWEVEGTTGRTIKTYTTSDTDGDNKGIVSLGKLTIGNTTTTYYIEEVTAPDGYNKLTKPVAVTVDTEGVVKLENSNTDGVDVDNSVATISWDSPYYTVKIDNKAGYALPETGGIGTKLFYTLGASLLALAAVFYVLKRRRRRV